MSETVYNEFKLAITKAKVAGDYSKVASLALQSVNRALHGRGLEKIEAKRLLDGSAYNGIPSKASEYVGAYLLDCIVREPSSESDKIAELISEVAKADILLNKH